MKRARCKMPEIVEHGYKRLRLASKTLNSFDVVQPPQSHQQVGWETRAHSIAAWISNIPSHSESAGSFTVNNSQASDTMSDSSRLRDKKTQRRSRSCSPNAKSSQYRNTVLKPTNIFVDVVHTLPPEIEALLPSGLRDLLDLPHAPPISVTTYTEHTGESAWTREIAENIRQVAAVYRDECRELAGKPGSEPEYRTHLYGDVVEKLARFSPWRRTLIASCSDKSWLASLKPPASTPILSLPWPSLSTRYSAMKPQENMLHESAQISFASNIIHVEPSSEPFNFASPPTCTEPSESSVSDLNSTITTPQPDITVGISREAFSRDHASLLDYWQASRLVLSDPHATQGDMRCPFLIIEAKGLVTNGNLIGAQNQAAGGGACAIRLLASLAAQDPKADAPRIVFSCTTEGAIHELWIHFQIVDEENNPKQHMACLGAWRTTLDRHANEFVAALALILSWGVEVFYPHILNVLERKASQQTQEDSDDQDDDYILSQANSSGFVRAPRSRSTRLSRSQSASTSRSATPRPRSTQSTQRTNQVSNTLPTRSQNSQDPPLARPAMITNQAIQQKRDLAEAEGRIAEAKGRQLEIERARIQLEKEMAEWQERRQNSQAMITKQAIQERRDLLETEERLLQDKRARLHDERARFQLKKEMAEWRESQ